MVLNGKSFLCILCWCHCPSVIEVKNWGIFHLQKITKITRKHKSKSETSSIKDPNTSDNTIIMEHNSRCRGEKENRLAELSNYNNCVEKRLSTLIWTLVVVKVMVVMMMVMIIEKGSRIFKSKCVLFISEQAYPCDQGDDWFKSHISHEHTRQESYCSLHFYSLVHSKFLNTGTHFLKPQSFMIFSFMKERDSLSSWEEAP